MKLFAVITLVASISLIQASTEEEKKKLAEECAKLTGIDKGDVEKIEKGVVEADPKVADYLFCFYKKEGILNDAGEYQLDVIRADLTKMFSSEVAETFVENCTKEKYGSGTEASYHLTKCYFKYVPKKE